MPDDRVPLVETKDKSVEETKPLEAKTFDGKLNFLDDLEYHRFADNFDLSYDDRKNPHLANELSFLADWAKLQTKSDKRIDHIMAIKQLTRNLGISHTGKDLIKKLYQWTRLDGQRKDIEKEMETING